MGDGDVDPETGKVVNVTGILVSAGIVIRPSERSETTAGRVETVNWPRVREPLSIMTSISTVGGVGIPRRSMLA
jgi:predicted aconitase with swiveling domain